MGVFGRIAHESIVVGQRLDTNIVEPKPHRYHKKTIEKTRMPEVNELHWRLATNSMQPIARPNQPTQWMVFT